MNKRILIIVLISLSVFISGCENKIIIPATTETPVSTQNVLNTPKIEERSQQYIQYLNTRFGFSIEYPSSFVTTVVPDNDDGRIFSSPDGNTELTVSGINNILNQTPMSAYNDLLQEHDNVSYKKQQGNWFVVSWVEGDKIVYYKSVVGSGSINTFRIIYPASQKDKYNLIISHLITSFKTPAIESGNFEYE